MACQLFNQSFTIGAESGNLILSGERYPGDPPDLSRINNLNITPDNNSPIYITDKKSGRRLKCNYYGSNGPNQGVQYRQERVYHNLYGTLAMNWGVSLDIPTELRDKVIADPSKSYGAHSAENVSLLFYDATTDPPVYYGRYSMFRTFPVTQQIIQNYYKSDGSYRLTNTFFIMINSKNYADHQPINTPQYKASVSYVIRDNNIGRYYYKVEFLEEIEFESIAAGLYPLNLPPLT